MKNLKAKLAALFAAIGCFTLCFGAGVAVSQPLQDTEIVASAETTCTVNSLYFLSGSAKGFYALPNSGLDDALKLDNWGAKYTPQEGASITLNGTALVEGEYAIKQPGDFFIELFVEVPDGAELALNGAFLNADTGIVFAFKDCHLKWNGTAWEGFNPVGKLGVHNNSLPGGAIGTTNNALYLTRGDGETTPNFGWGKHFALESGAGVKVNGVPTSFTLQIPGFNQGDFYLEGIPALNAGDTLTIGGTFVNAALFAKVVIADTTLTWTGEGWVTEPERYTIATLTPVWPSNDPEKAGQTTIYLEADTTLPDLDWNNYNSFFWCTSGAGVKANDVAVDGAFFRSVVDDNRDLYLEGLPALEAGQKVTIEGVFTGIQYGVTYEYTIAKNTFVWDGSAWSAETAYTPHTLGELTIHANSVPGGAVGHVNTGVYLMRKDGAEIPGYGWVPTYLFTLENGTGVKINGNPVSFDLQSPGGNTLYLDGISLQAGDKLTIGGTFVCEEKSVRYIITDTTLIWTGEGWLPYIDESTNIGKLGVHANSLPGGLIGTTNNALYLTRGDGKTTPNFGWNKFFVFESGTGVKVNNEPVPFALEIPGAGQGDLYLKNLPAFNAGDTLTIGGTFVNAALYSKVVIADTTLTWNGAGWVTEPERYTINTLTPVWPSDDPEKAGQTTIYLDADATLPQLGWDQYNSVFRCTSGTGVKANGVAVGGASFKSIVEDNRDLYLEGLPALEAGQTVTIEGVFTGIKYGVTYEYTIAKNTFVWNGSAWNIPLQKVELGTVASVEGDATSAYFVFADGKTLPISSWDKAFDCISGNGITINGVEINMVNTLKSVGNKLYASFDAVSVGAVLKIGGTFRYDPENVEYVVEDSEFVWNGAAWNINEEIQYDEIELGKMSLDWPSESAKDAHSYEIYLNPNMEFAFKDGNWAYNYAYEPYSGNGAFSGVMLNGEEVVPLEIKFPEIGKSTVYFKFAHYDAGNLIKGFEIKKGDIISIAGVFYNQETGVKYFIEDASYEWNGTVWMPSYLDANLAYYDTVTIYDLGLGYGDVIPGVYAYDEAGRTYEKSEDNPTGSVKFRFGYYSTDIASGCLDIRLRGTAWNGIRVQITAGHINSLYQQESKSYDLENNKTYVIEIGAINTEDDDIWVYIKVDGALVISDTLSPDHVLFYEETKPTAGSCTTGSVSLSANANTTAVITHADYVSVNYTTEHGSFVEFAQRNTEYTLAGAKSYNTFLGWAANDILYSANQNVDVADKELTFTAVDIDFNLDPGAAIRLASTMEESGIRFTTLIKEEDLEALEGKYGITNIAYGTLIIPYDYLKAGQTPNLENFEDGKTILKIPSTYSEMDGEYRVYRGAMTKLFTANYDRLFAGCGYMEITFTNGEVKTFYTTFNAEDNVRSVRYVAQELQSDKTEYEDLSDNKQSVVNVYAASDTIKLMNYDSEYYDNNIFNVIAWYYPKLDESNNYNNATNIAIAQKLKDAGMTAVYLDGNEHLNLDTYENVEKTRQIIEFFWTQGLKTIAFGSNSGDENFAIDYEKNTFPDYSDCEGFIGFLVWDEPHATAQIDTIASFAKNFDIVYAGTNATFMTNLLPSYATQFQQNSTSIWGGSSTLKKDEYKAYLQEYINTVLSNVKGQKWLSMDSYPIFKDKSLGDTFLFDLGMLKTSALEAGAHAHAVLQSSGWTEDGNDEKNRMPTEAEMRMQAYAAMAFGVDSISWWSYANKRGDNQQNPTDSDEYYNRFAKVNNELAAISSLYSAFNWKGVILGVGKNNGTSIGSWEMTTDKDYQAFKTVIGELGEYELSASDTKHLSSVSNSKTDWNYLLGVMQDMNGNEGYVLCNYNNHAADRTQTITLSFATNVTQVIIYRGGEAQTVSVSGQELEIELATGEGVIILPSELG